MNKSTNKSRRAQLDGRIMHVADSKSGGWGILKANKIAYFFHRQNVLSGYPQVGGRAKFTALPPGPNGALKRATELTIVPGVAIRKRRVQGEIKVVRLPDGRVRVTLRDYQREVMLGELQIEGNEPT